MITIIPALEIIKTMIDKNIAGHDADLRRKSIDEVIDLMSLSDVDILLEGNLFDKITTKLSSDKNKKEDQSMIFLSICRIDKSTIGVKGYDIEKSINWIAQSEAKLRNIIILTNNPATYLCEISDPDLNKDNKIITISPEEFISKSKRAKSLYLMKLFQALDLALNAVFFYDL